MAIAFALGGGRFRFKSLLWPRLFFTLEECCKVKYKVLRCCDVGGQMSRSGRQVLSYSLQTSHSHHGYGLLPCLQQNFPTSTDLDLHGPEWRESGCFFDRHAGCIYPNLLFSTVAPINYATLCHADCL